MDFLRIKNNEAPPGIETKFELEQLSLVLIAQLRSRRRHLPQSFLRRRVRGTPSGGHLLPPAAESEGDLGQSRRATMARGLVLVAHPKHIHPKSISGSNLADAGLIRFRRQGSERISAEIDPTRYVRMLYKAANSRTARGERWLFLGLRRLDRSQTALCAGQCTEVCVSSTPEPQSARESLPETREEHIIVHVLFMDIVDSTRETADQQKCVNDQLQAIVSSTSEFHQAKARNELISLPTGDGMALVFTGKFEAPLRCAIEIARALKSTPICRLRTGIHSGPVHN
jgi:hypothetical protein